MAGKRKYEKYVCENQADEAGDNVGTANWRNVIHFDCRNNEEAPAFIEVNLMNGAQDRATAGGGGGKVSFPAGSYYSSLTENTPQKHACEEIFLMVGTDPDNREDLGSTVEFWVGEGDEAERYIVDKPTAFLPPPMVAHTPLVCRDSRKPSVCITTLASPWWAGIWVPTPPAYFKNLPADAKINRLNKYGEYETPLKVNNLPIHPSHKGKAAPMGRYDRRYHDEVNRFVDCQLIYGSGVGFGVGDPTQFPSFPNKHPWYQTFTFFGVDMENPADLGGTVEFWIGEGANAEEYLITRATTVLVPPHTVHLPIYFREVHKPIMMVTILDTPLWAGAWVDKFPPGFKHVAPPRPDIRPVMS